MSILLNSFHNFMKESGVYDARVEFFELGSRYLLDNKNQIDEIANTYTIYLNRNELPVIINDIKKTYLVLTFSSFEEFLDAIKNEILCYFEFEYTVKPEETKYSKLKKILPSISKKFIENDFEENCLEYYRLIRNSFVHKSTKNLKEIDSQYKKILKIERPAKYRKYKNSPSTYEHIEFEDFILLTVIIKNIVKKIAIACNPNINDVLSKIKWNDIIKRISYLSNKKRKLQAVLNILKTDYYLNDLQNDIVEKILDQQDHW